MANEKKRLKINISGQVQGVGFRPTVYGHAIKAGITGYVNNTSLGVDIEAEGLSKEVDNFLFLINEFPPPKAKIESIKTLELEPKGYSKFDIMITDSSKGKSVLISPDMATCKDCEKELFDKNDRRYNYPFINCTNCGPRFTIIKDRPYDRSKTSMHDFLMCLSCQDEYDDPLNRRFHAQPNACPECGPKVSLLSKSNQELSKGNEALLECIKHLKEGKIIALKGLGGFHLACDATNNEACATLRKRKRRSEKPLALMADSLDKIKKYAYINKLEKSLLTSDARPIVLLKKLYPDTLNEQVSIDNNYLGFMLPYTPLHLVLAKEFEILVMTSCNFSEEPIVSDLTELATIQNEVCDFVLINNRDIVHKCDDSIVMAPNEINIITVRRSRGYVPSPIITCFNFPKFLACGAEKKNTFSFSVGNKVFISQHIGDLKDLRSYEFYKSQINDFKNLLEIEPEFIVHDSHPDYLSTLYADEEGLKKISVQHHHAHMAATMAEAGVQNHENVLGICFDGTGLGEDNTVWGGEFLYGNYASFKQVGSFEQFSLPGGDKASLEPYRIALALGSFSDYDASYFETLLTNHYGEDLSKNIKLISKMIQNKSPFIQTSSLGRLFDGISSLIGLAAKASYEAQAAIKLERVANVDIEEYYPVNIEKNDINVHRIQLKPIINSILKDLEEKKDISKIASKFHNSIAISSFEMAKRLSIEFAFTKIALGGGCFQNSLLLNKTIEVFKGSEFELLIPKEVPINDAGISFGQTMVALHKINS
ncbi:MAG: carbamoyltransferase HypF [Pseudomonadota bacterium]